MALVRQLICVKEWRMFRQRMKAICILAKADYLENTVPFCPHFILCSKLLLNTMIFVSNRLTVMETREAGNWPTGHSQGGDMANVQSPSGNEKSEKKEREKLVGMPTQYILCFAHLIPLFPTIFKE